MANLVGMAFQNWGLSDRLMGGVEDIEDVNVVLVGGEGCRELKNVVWVDMVIVYGPSPSPCFLDYMTGLMQDKGAPPMVVIGDPGQYVRQALRFEGMDIQYVSEDVDIEGFKGLVLHKLRNFYSSRVRKFTPVVDRKYTKPKRGYLTSGKIHLNDLIQTLAAKEWTGRVDILNEDSYEQGSLYISKGEVIHAETDNYEGEASCHTMLTWKRCNFQFVKEEPIVARTVHSWEQILLDRALQATRHSEELRACA